MKKKPVETGAEKGARIADEMKELDKHAVELRERRAALSKQLGFDCENGGRRLGELRCEPIPSMSGYTLLHIDWTSVTFLQAQAIQKALHSPEAARAVMNIKVVYHKRF